MIDQIHNVKINGKDYPFAYSQSAFTRAHAMPGAKQSELVLQYAVFYQCILKGCKRENIPFPFPLDQIEGVDFITDLCDTDRQNGGNAKEVMMGILEQATGVNDADEDAKKNSPLTKSNGTSSGTVESEITSKQSQEPLTTIYTPGEIVT